MSGPFRLTDLFEERQVITTTAILLEIGNALARRRYRASAADLLRSAHNDPQVQVVPLDDSLYFEG
ncbi:MAG TPA: hypothetical protein VLU25_07225, partial [Acidobacteriota bacterium]|nr:hypothetical protein [Acidobacteriota bacterium]